MLSKLDDVVVFVAVADAGGFTAAARRLGLTTAAVSKAITRLEQRLSTRLFTRTTRAVHMTDAGSRYYTRCRPALEELARGEDEALEEAGSMRGRIRVELPTSFGRTIVIPLLAEFQRTYPDIALDIRLNDRYVDLVEQSVDVAVRFGTLKDSTLNVHRLGMSRTCTCASPAYLEQYGAPRSIAELEQHRLITYLSQQTRRPYPWFFRVNGEVQTQLQKSRIEIDDSGANRALAVAGAGIIQDLSCHLWEDLLTGRLVEILSEFSAPALEVSLVFPSGRDMPSRVRAVVKFLRTRLTANVIDPLR
ncbi:LysR substrate-binding domain-containing protein [Hyalangium rubrum]|uniref:LysR substrate-binding domain-containing protein n=1 Tax=Hyalangium rubrum TaxID=3103134 RepID=A0ABU5HET3_9BACT|nr:LysR substrate-binding domain-containing protein [Hyalangium sp. s54d21]MDY7231996.1 LysR substrate-binding domain-containing protein [Hyalangium sp. s54d21]